MTTSQGHNLSFAGCGFLGLYHAGVCGCLQVYAPQLYKNQRISGCSAGAIAATFLMCDVDLSDCIQHLIEIINKSRDFTFGPFDPRFKVTQLLIEGLEKYLPENAHEICFGRLYISMTDLNTSSNFVATHYHDRAELIQAIVCSTYIPVFSGFVPLIFRGRPMIDGGLTKNLLELDSNTITVSPLSGDANICPKDDFGYGQINMAGMNILLNPDNLKRLLHIVCPKTPIELAKLTQHGYSDTLKYLTRKGFIKCETHCIKTVLLRMEMEPSNQMLDADCVQCKRRLQSALSSTINQSILDSITHATPKSNSYLWQIFRKLYESIVSVMYVGTRPIYQTVQMVNSIVNLVSNIPEMILISPVIKVAKGLVYMDEILQDAVSRALETGNSHRPLHEAIKRIQFIDNFNDNPQSSSNYISDEYFNEDSDKIVIMKESEDDAAKQWKLRVPPHIIDSEKMIESTNFKIANEGTDEITLSDNENNELDETEAEKTTSSNVKESKEFDLDCQHQLKWAFSSDDDPTKLNYYVISGAFSHEEINRCDQES